MLRYYWKNLTDRGVVLKPDLVVQTRDRVLVVDVTVRHEDRDYLENGRQEKINKYTRLLPQLKERFGASEDKVVPIAIRSRRGMPKSTMGDLKSLGIKDRKTALTLLLIAVRSSIELYHTFMELGVHVLPTATCVS
ncbi:uncharacterized protein LOC123009105 [Tribolium madens]|uniref:uncharacterized protein LOC123009105 n=1 Tax=Tribolium madens TaxID=41895 RepID=UPI001CF73F3F|nr:uncharacterized protein LOC123009105 [Tribolium madens]